MFVWKTTIELEDFFFQNRSYLGVMPSFNQSDRITFCLVVKYCQSSDNFYNLKMKFFYFKRDINKKKVCVSNNSLITGCVPLLRGRDGNGRMQICMEKDNVQTVCPIDHQKKENQPQHWDPFFVKKYLYY